MQSFVVATCPHCGVRVFVIDDDRCLLLNHIRRNHRPNR